MPFRLHQLSKSGVGRKNKSTTETTRFLPTDTKYVMKSECKRKQMADGEEWEETRRAPCSSPLGPPPPCYIHSLLFTTVQKNKGGKRGLCACICVYVCVLIPIRGCVFFLHYLSFLSSQQFYFQPII